MDAERTGGVLVTAGPRVAEALASDVERVRAALRVLPAAEQSHALNRLAELAARLLHSESGQVSILTSEQVAAATGGAASGRRGTAVPLSEAFCTIATVTSAPVVIPDATVDIRVRHLAAVAAGAVGSYLGVPLTISAGPTIGALCVYSHEPHEWSTADVALLSHLASTVVAELELAALTKEYDASRRSWELAVEAAGIGSFDWDLRSGQVEADARLQALHGWPAQDLVPTASAGVAESFQQVHPDDLPRLNADIAEALASGGEFRTEYRVRWADGSTHWLGARGRTVADAGGKPARLLGSAWDMTEIRTAKDEASGILAAMTTGFVSLDHGWRVTSVNAAGERLLARTAEELVGTSLWEAFPGLDEMEFGRRYRQAMTDNEPVQFEAHYPGDDRWYDVRAVPGSAGLAVYFLDISERRLAQQQAEVAAARLELLATVSAQLSDSLVVDALVERLAQVVVPLLGDWCIVTLIDAGGGHTISSWHDDPARRALIERYSRARLVGINRDALLAQRVNDVPAAHIPSGMQAMAAAVDMPQEARDLLTEIGSESGAQLPLRAHGRTVGILSIGCDPARDNMSEADFAVAAEVASRAALALDNALMYADQRGRAEGLQRSLLTDPPKVDGLEIVGRYVAAAETASVGGDWFDAFPQADGTTVLVIGDVVGHDTEAAAAMGQLRGLLRGIAWQGDEPGEILQSLDAAIDGLQLPATATVVVGQLRRSADPSVATRLLWSNAGHPPPMAIRPDGTTCVLSGPVPDLLLGVVPQTPRTTHVIDLEPGTTVLMFTDGLVERRRPGIDVGLGDLAALLTELAGLPLDALCDALLERLLPERPDDDVALVAVRLRGATQPQG